MTTLGTVFDRRQNGLNLLRLILAAGVIVWHAFPLSGHTLGFAPASQLLGNVSVDGFFAISGFLITGSWLSRPRLLSFLRARALRLLPGFYVCLLFTALVLAPVMVTLTGGSLRLADELAYMRANGLLWVTRYDISGIPTGVPYEHVWNGSIWTLAWEAICYLGVAVLGLIGLIRRVPVVIALFGAVLLLALARDLGVVHHQTYLIGTGARFALMFLAGTLIQLLAPRIPVTPLLSAVAALLVAVAAFLPDYRLLAAIPLAYLLIVIGAAIRSPKLQLRNDISYGVYVYAFPVQQSLAMLGAWKLGVPVFALLGILMTAPFAAASWFGVERHALRLKSLTLRRSVQPVGQDSFVKIGRVDS
ncbi:acyltransferase [Microlunatus endophyticus]|uniref:Acyltransferase n=1 Tax=Microlunatus endophyticus TaxID=1716077 RepID=A0A917W3G9_9ACTN|nr:acyltransferase [Microlunatus endophyticus]GGL59339.1 acyltransferase [Microlunatus endophyticus]